MTNKLVVGSDQKPTSDQLLEMYEKLDSQTKEIRGQMKRGVLTPRHIQALIEHRNPFPKKEEAAVGNGFSVTVNYDLSVESLVAQGKYDWQNLDINSKHFQTTRKGEITLNLELVHLNRVLTSEEVLKELDKRGLRPAELHELLSFGAKYPEEQRKYPIVALDSVWQGWDGDRVVPYLWGVGGERDLGFWAGLAAGGTRAAASGRCASKYAGIPWILNKIPTRVYSCGDSFLKIYL